MSNYGVTDAGRDPLADGDGRQDDEQNCRDLTPGEGVELFIARTIFRSPIALRSV